MIWEHVAYLWFLLVIPLLVFALWYYKKKIRKVRRKYFSDSLFQSLQKGYWKWGDRLRQIAIYLSLACFIVALAGPKVGTEVREVKRKGVDMLIALDLSASMNAEDIKPSRLDKAKYEINRIIDRLKGDRVGLIIFTGEAYLQSPLTLDYSAMRLFLNIANTDQLPSSSTDIGEALEVADRAFENEEEQNSNASKVLLIVSDGENHGSNYEEQLSALTEKQVNVFSLGLGTRTGAKIPIYENDTGQLVGYKRNEQGKVVTSVLKPQVLQQIANDGNGKYYEIQRGSQGIDAFLGAIDELEKGEFASQEYADFKNQYQIVLGTGLAFFLLYFFIPAYKRDKDKA